MEGNEFAIKKSEFFDRNLLGSEVGRKVELGQNLGDLRGGQGKGLEVVEESFSSLSEGHSQERLKARGIFDGIEGFISTAEGDKGRFDSGRRGKRPGRHNEMEMNFKVQLEKNGEGGILFRARSSGQTLGDFFLEQEKAAREKALGFENLKEERRGDGVREVANELDSALRIGFRAEELCPIDPEHVLVHDDDVSLLIFLEEMDEIFIFLDGDDFPTAVGESKSQSAFARPDFDDEILLLGRDDGENFRDDARIGEKMLTERFSLSHLCGSGLELP